MTVMEQVAVTVIEEVAVTVMEVADQKPCSIKSSKC